MRVRRGLVSNSSSSSFLVLFPKKPESVAEIQEMLFGKTKYFCGWPVEGIAAIVFRATQDKDNTSASAIFCEVEDIDPYAIEEDLFLSERKGVRPSDYSNSLDVMISKVRNEVVKDYNASISKTLEGYVRGLAGRLSGVVGGGFLCRFEFSDNDGDPYSHMEHRDLFHNLPHIMQSHH